VCVFSLPLRLTPETKRLPFPFSFLRLFARMIHSLTNCDGRETGAQSHSTKVSNPPSNAANRPEKESSNLDKWGPDFSDYSIGLRSIFGLFYSRRYPLNVYGFPCRLSSWICRARLEIATPISFPLILMILKGKNKIKLFQVGTSIYVRSTVSCVSRYSNSVVGDCLITICMYS
jgi:hypothetical protein